MTEPMEVPRGNRWLFAAGVGLVLGAGVLGWWWSRRECGCEHEEDQESDPVGSMLARRRQIGREALARIRGAENGTQEPVVDLLSWDTHTESAWGAVPAGPMPLATWVAPDDAAELDEFELELGGEG